MKKQTIYIEAGQEPTPDYASVHEVTTNLVPEWPVHLLRPKYLYGRIHQFTTGFPGTIAYAVRANFDSLLLAHVYAGGVEWFSCDTLAEIETVARLLPDAKFFFAHPIKSDAAIEQAYKKHRVRAFVLDHPDELAKLKRHVGTDAILVVRIAAPPGALLGEGYRYGCDIDRAVTLSRAVVDAGYKLGLCFNLGSQIMDPSMFDEAFLMMREVMYRARFMLDMVCVGGGFPAIYDGLVPPKMEEYFDVIKKGLARLHLPRTCRVIATPGRALVNDAVSILTRVEQRRGQMLYLNDGSLGGLGSINVPWWRPTTRLVRPHGKAAKELERFVCSGPAGYGNDTMPGPFYLPEDAKTGDYIEFGQLGAYSGCMITAFHCCPWPEMVTVGDDAQKPARQDELPDDVADSMLEEDGAEGLEEDDSDYDDSFDEPNQLPRRR